MMSLQERATQMMQASTGLFNDYPNTSKWIKFLADSVLAPKATCGEVAYALKEVFSAFRVEYIGCDETSKYRERCYDSYIKLMWEMIEKGAAFETFNKLLPAFESGTYVTSNIAEIYHALVSSEDLSDKRRYFGLCFMYQLMLEGVYDEDIRILYLMKKSAEGVTVEYQTIEHSAVRDLLQELDPVFAEGYLDRLRNSIAHAKFRFDDKTEKMVFKDYNVRTKSPFSLDLTIKEFGENYYGKIDSFCRLRHRYMLLLGLRELVRLPQPFPLDYSAKNSPKENTCVK